MARLRYALWRWLARRYYREDWSRWPPRSVIRIRRWDPLWWLWLRLPVPTPAINAAIATRQQKRRIARRIRAEFTRRQQFVRREPADRFS